MRSALLCVFFTSIIQVERIRAQSDDFRPTPIPLNEWHHRRGSRGEVLPEIKTDSPPSAAIVPAHYWEDALRHSVYLTLVRDRIDQLIAKGDGVSPNSKTTSYESKEIDDHDLWNKIKTAPFNRLPEEEPAAIGDVTVTVMAKGRLLENKEGFSFAEDKKSKENCNDEICLQGVKAFWSVKRIKQRDHETSQGRYHYELTFSVISQKPKKQKKPHENPIRTFTVRESFPKGIIDKPQEYRKSDTPKIQTRRPERAVWFHKNIAPVKQIGRRQFLQGFDKIFTTLFSGEDARDYDAPPPKYKLSPNGFLPGHPYSKIGHLGVPAEQHQIPYPYRPNQSKQIRPSQSVLPVNPIQQTYLDIGQITTANSNLFSLYPYAHRDSNSGIKTTRPAVLPTPLPPIVPQRDYSAEVTQQISLENIDNITIVPDIMKYQLPYNKYKQIPVKVNYFPEHVRPPVYSAPPGVFVTMDKKPFKPLPPLKYLHFSKLNRQNRPIDFRPSPQVMDVLFSDPDSFSDTAFKPITAGYNDTDTTTNLELTGSRKKNENKTRKTNLNGKKPLKKHENIKHVSTAVPEIITAQSLSAEIETLDWANILGAFTKTTPMVSQAEPVHILETTTPMSTTVTTASPKKRITTTTEAERETTTTSAPKKRTRPPQKLVKQEKIKKHKRITTTTTTTTTTTNAPENIKRRPTHDLIPQASSAATGTIKSFRDSHNKTISSSSNSTTTTSTTTTTTTTSAPSTTTTKIIIPSTTQPKNKNRFRQSTLMLKGTSVKHDRWNSGHKAQSNGTITPTSSLHRRKGSNFQGYILSTTPRMPDEGRRGKDHADRKPITASTEASIAKVTETTSQTQSMYDETVDQYETNSVLPLRHLHEEGDSIYDEDTNEPKDNSEYTFQTTPSVKNRNIEKLPSLIQLPTPLAQSKNKTKCKKKKQNILTTEGPNELDSDSATLTERISLVPSTARTSAEMTTGNDILDELFNFNFNSGEEKLNKTSKKTEQEEDNLENVKFDDILGVLEGITKKPIVDSQYDDDEDENENDDDDDDESVEDYGDNNMLSIDDSTALGDDGDDEKESARDSNDDVPPHDRPFSFLELMAMS